ncbi:hypothetical protein J2Z22_002087 [Paenibacillus forsythiae]|uniref:Uncharacterized protein n=1 Tax=Paenibacillus forsythiae TaxID=365616 RepID=A0ABU3H757_9BACL|nr:hypothetical protein [Paenibacillus forsythiae]MDT3426561.1 hypothetical protein [Paenibacillus forsythiae]
MSWIYVIAVIIFAIVSQANKANKNKNKNGGRPGGMPPFGSGPGEGPLRRQRSGQPRPERAGESRSSGFPFPAPASRPPEPQMAEGQERDTAPAFPEPALLPSPDYMTGEGMSMEQPEEEDGVEARQERMRQELERVHRALDRISDDMGGDGGTGPKSASAPSSSQSPVSLGAGGDLRSGLIWAEILGPPRSRKPLSSRRQGHL